MQRTNGFTLIELLVVVGLLGIIIAAVLVNMNSAKRKAYDTVAMSCAQDIARKEKIVQTRHESYRAFELLPDTSVCQPLVALDATPTGNAEELNFAYEVRHPRGVTTYTVTDSEIYENGVSRTGALLTDDPAAPLVLGAGGGGPIGGGGGPIGGGGPGGPETLQTCVDGSGIGTLVQGTLDSGGITLTDGQLDGNGVAVATSTQRYTRLSHNIVGYHVTDHVNNQEGFGVYAFLEGVTLELERKFPLSVQACQVDV